MRCAPSPPCDRRLSRVRSRSLNNALALASQCVKEPNNRPGRSRWVPSVCIQGKLHHRVGPLEPDVNEHGNVETRKFAQLYVHDPATEDDGAEFDARAAGMKFGSSTSNTERERVLSLLGALQSTMHDENTYVQDFMMAGELFATDGLDNAELIISRDARPADEHARRYDPSSGGAPRIFQEVTVLVGEGHVKSGCIELRR